MSLGAGFGVAVNPLYFEEWKRSEAAKTLVESVGKKVARKADELAPNDPDRPPGTFALHTSMRAETLLTKDGWICRVKALNFKARWYEFGTSKQEPHPFLRPAALALGLTLEDAD